jgi:acetyltransferase
MSIQNLQYFFAPKSIAVIGASERPRSVGNIVMRNLLDGRFAGPILPVNPRREAVAGVLTYKSVADLPLCPELAVICTPGPAVPGVIDDLGKRGTRAAIVAADMSDPDALLDAARRYDLRLLGGASLGVCVPKANLYANFAHMQAHPGRVAFVSQSGALCAAALDWAKPRGIGFSCVVSLGDAVEIDFADLMDYLSKDEETKAILLHIETIRERRGFVSAARAAARNKPVLILKGGNRASSHSIGHFLSETLASPDGAFDATVRRAGALRVYSIDELFAAVETLSRTKQVRGERLAILSNAGGAALMAIDEINTAERGSIADLSEKTLSQLAKALPRGRRLANPVDLGAGASADDYAAALKVLSEALEVDGILIIHAPNAMTDSSEIARSVIEAQKRYRSGVLACWLGGETASAALALFAEAGLCSYNSIGAAVGGFGHIVQHRRNLAMLMETPPADLANFAPDRATARSIVESGLSRPDGVLSEPDSRRLLASYGIPTLESILVETADEAAVVAERIGYPVAVTLSSPDLPRKWDAGAVALNLENAEAVRSAADGIMRRVRNIAPEVRIEGFALQRMVVWPHSRQLMMGISCDPLFGPVLVFGEGGRAVELVRDHTVALPPLNLPLARQMIDRTRISKRLEAHGLRPKANRDAIAQALVRLSALLVDNPEITACDINPLFANHQGVVAVDARIQLAASDDTDSRRFSILPYPSGMEEAATLHDGSPIILRPIRPEDEPAHADLIGRTSPQDLRYRFFGSTQKLQHHQLARMTQIDYDREMAFIATATGTDGHASTLGVVRTVTDPDNKRAELAILVRSDLKGTGLGSILMDRIIRYHRTRKTDEIGAQVISGNEPMLRLAAKFGFAAVKGDDPELVECTLRLIN